MVQLRYLALFFLTSPLLGFNVGDVVFKIENGSRVYGVVFNPLTNTGFTGVAWDDGTQSFPSPNILALLAEKVFGADVNVGDNVIGVQPPNGNTVQGGQIVEFNGDLDSARIHWDDDTFTWRGRAWFISSLDLTPEIGAALGEELLVILDEGQFSSIDDALESIDLQAAQAVESLGNLVTSNNLIDQELNNIRELLVTDEQQQFENWIELENLNDQLEELKNIIDEEVENFESEELLRKIDIDITGVVPPVIGEVPANANEVNVGANLVYQHPDPNDTSSLNGQGGTVSDVDILTGDVTLQLDEGGSIITHYLNLHDGEPKVYLDFDHEDPLPDIVWPPNNLPTFQDVFDSKISGYIDGKEDDMLLIVTDLVNDFMTTFEINQDVFDKLTLSGDLPSFNLGTHLGTSTEVDIGNSQYASLFGLLKFLFTLGVCYLICRKTFDRATTMIAS